MTTSDVEAVAIFLRVVGDDDAEGLGVTTSDVEAVAIFPGGPLAGEIRGWKPLPTRPMK